MTESCTTQNVSLDFEVSGLELLSFWARPHLGRLPMHVEIPLVVHAVFVGLDTSRSLSLSVLHIVHVKVSVRMQSAFAGIVASRRLASDMLGKLRPLHSFCIKYNLPQSLPPQLPQARQPSAIHDKMYMMVPTRS